MVARIKIIQIEGSKVSLEKFQKEIKKKKAKNKETTVSIQ